MNPITNASRRGFLKGLAGTGAFVLGVRYLPGMAVPEDLPAYRTEADLATLHPSVFLGLNTDGTVFMVAHRSEMGTVIRSTLPLVVADELDADWKRVKIDQAIGDPRYGDQNTRRLAFNSQLLRRDAAGWGDRASHADSGCRPTMGCGSIAMQHRPPRGCASCDRSPSRLRRTCHGGIEIASTQERRRPTKTKDRLAVHWKGNG